MLSIVRILKILFSKKIHKNPKKYPLKNSHYFNKIINTKMIIYFRRY